MNRYMNQFVTIVLTGIIFIGVLSIFLHKKLHFGENIYHKSMVIENKVETKQIQDFSKSNKIKEILIWNKLYKDPKFGLRSLGSEPFADCAVSQCSVTGNHSRLNVSNAVVFFMARSRKDLPNIRYPGQIYVQVNKESPTYNVIDVDDAINLTMTYRRDSDLYFPYFQTIWSPSKSKSMRYVSQHKNKTKAVFWMVSNCKTLIGREHYAKELAKYIDVDIIGSCGNTTCPKSDMYKCITSAAKTYKFYLSFENSFCEDYVTEKVTRPAHNDMLPIVLGGTNYTRDMPPYSYINVLDYRSPRHLAKYLHYLMKNDTAYWEYFQWRPNYKMVSRGSTPSFCDLCKTLHDDSFHKTYPHFLKWWSEGRCNNDILKGQLNL